MSSPGSDDAPAPEALSDTALPALEATAVAERGAPWTWDALSGGLVD